jgi:hypothetical protein
MSMGSKISSTVRQLKAFGLDNCCLGNAWFSFFLSCGWLTPEFQTLQNGYRHEGDHWTRVQVNAEHWISFFSFFSNGKVSYIPLEVVVTLS